MTNHSRITALSGIRKRLGLAAAVLFSAVLWQPGLAVAESHGGGSHGGGSHGGGHAGGGHAGGFQGGAFHGGGGWHAGGFHGGFHEGQHGQFAALHNNFGGHRDGGWRGRGYGWGGGVGLGLGLGWGLGYPDWSYYTPNDYGYDGYSQPYAAGQVWYYCSDPAGYYPYVAQCYTGWQAVPAS